MLVDKFLEDGDKKTAICDALGGKMNAVYDYGQRRKEEGIEEGKIEGKKEGIKEGIIEGKKEGKIEGIKEENEKIAIEMIKNNEDEEKIKKYTRLNDRQINKLKEKISSSN